MERKNPSTSIDAYKSINAEQKREIYKKIKSALQVIGKGTFEQIANHLEMDASKIWKRLSEMERLEIVFRPGEKDKLKSGRRGLVWYLTGSSFPKDRIVEKVPKGKSVADYSRSIHQISKQVLQASLF